MNHSAVDLFPSWYSKGVNKDVLEAELNLRRSSIAEVLKIDDKTFWLKLLRVYSGIDKLNSQAYTDIVDQVRKGDSNFIIDNENVVRIVSGCAIAQKIEENGSWISDFLALSLLSLEFNLKYSPLILDLQRVAKIFWISECEKKREINTDFKITETEMKGKDLPPLPTLAADPTALQAHADGLAKAAYNSQADVNTLFSEINSLNAALWKAKKNFVALSEETNILWWLFGASSSMAEKSFNKLSADQLSIFAGIELAKLTMELPGIGGLESIINKALSSVEYEPGQIVEVGTIIESIRDFQEKIKPQLPKDNAELHLVTPLLVSLRSFCDHAGTEWKSITSKATGLDLNHKVNHVHFSHQIYKEIMLVSVFELI